jgi:AcrR family transcriptional regulator
VNNVNITKRAYHHGNLRPALIQATLRAIAEDGPDGFTLRDVARRAGVSPAAPYRHFQDKDELLAAVAAECADRFVRMILEAVAQAPADDPLARFRQVGIASVEFAAAHPEHFRAFNLPGILSRLPAEQRQRFAAWNEDQARALAAAQEAGAIARIPLDELMLAASALVHGLGHLIVEGQLGEVSPDRARQLAIAVTGVLGLGLLPRAAGDAILPPPPLSAPRQSPPAAPPREPVPTPKAPPVPAPTSKQLPRKGMRNVGPRRGR